MIFPPPPRTCLQKNTSVSLQNKCWEKKVYERTLAHQTERSCCVLTAGLQSSNKSSAYPVRMDNSVPIVPQNQSAQSMQIQPSMLAQVCTPGTSLPRCYAWHVSVPQTNRARAQLALRSSKKLQHQVIHGHCRVITVCLSGCYFVISISRNYWIP